ncbi:hypothetical protein CI1B_74640 [Bradyrhizobium ivorense]|uniref:Uncharacterized protein n=1 Tax=Bradyrhizobium ivorense TaxID=2511166 RepID=A0A508TWU2_9BRAD|nr:hypothetical protein CI1B_74640 [Bradyrhizobium ivorense]
MLQSAHSNYEIGPLKNLHQPVKNALIVMGTGLEVFVQYALGLTDGLKSKLLIGHNFLPIRLVGDREIKEG